MIEILDEIRGSKVIAHEREYDGDYDNETTWDYYILEDGRACVYREGFFWEWIVDPGIGVEEDDDQ